MPRKREPKTIEEARTLILATVPDACAVTISSYWYDDRDGGTHYSNRNFDCAVSNNRHLKIHVQASTPAELVKKVITAIANAEAPTGVIVVDPVSGQQFTPRRAARSAARPKPVPRLRQASLPLLPST